MGGFGRRHFAAAVALLLVAGAPAAHAQSYPDHPVRLIADSAPGSAIDVPIRIIAETLSRVWGQQAVVVNQPGGGGAIAAHAAASAVPDGYTLGVLAVSAFVALPGAADNLPVEVPRDFAPVGYLGGAPMFVTAAPWVGVRTLAELIDLAKRKPGELSYGVNGIGRLTHLTGELLQDRAGIKLLAVPYSGGTAAVLSDMLGGRIALVFDSYSGIAGAVESGSVRPLAVASAQRLANFPGLPTVAETLPGFEASGWQVLVAPKGTPDAIVHKANIDLVRAMNDFDTRKKLADLGRDERPMSAAETLAFVQGEQQKWAPILKQIGPVK
jgi:tripartite-type tricarboxylate transporter receptor subunit TctC